VRFEFLKLENIPLTTNLPKMLIDPTATGTLTEMEKFPKFPPEIRFEIWRLTFA
jgi:hypothetical protein